MNCKYNDCGFCYAPEGIPTNDQAGQCNSPQTCPSMNFNCWNQTVEDMPGDCDIPQEKPLMETILGHKPPARQYLNYFYWRVHKPHCVLTEPFAPIRVGDLAFYHTEALKYAQQKGWIE